MGKGNFSDDFKRDAVAQIDDLITLPSRFSNELPLRLTAAAIDHISGHEACVIRCQKGDGGGMFVGHPTAVQRLLRANVGHHFLAKFFGLFLFEVFGHDTGTKKLPWRYPVGNIRATRRQRIHPNTIPPVFHGQYLAERQNAAFARRIRCPIKPAHRLRAYIYDRACLLFHHERQYGPATPEGR